MNPESLRLSPTQTRILREMKRGKPLYFRRGGPITKIGSAIILAPERTIHSMLFKGLIVWSSGKHAYVLTQLAKNAVCGQGSANE